MSDVRSTHQVSGDDIVVRDLQVALISSGAIPTVRIDQVRVVVLEPAFHRLVATAARRAGVNASGSLNGDQISVAISVSLLRLTATFGATVANGLLILEPRGGLPGWLLGRAAPMVERTAGLTMGSNGRITVDPSAFVPTGVDLPTGFTAVRIDPNGISFTLG